MMETTEINGEVLKKIIKCKEGEFIFATYDSTKDPEITSDEVQEVVNYCQENGCQCLFLPEKDEQVSVALQDKCDYNCHNTNGVSYCKCHRNALVVNARKVDIGLLCRTHRRGVRYCTVHHTDHSLEWFPSGKIEQICHYSTEHHR